MTIPWPASYVPTWAPINARNTDPLPRADALVVTYTEAEGKALSDTLTPGHPSSDWTSYTNGWGDLRPLVGPRGPSLQSDRAGCWAVTDIGDRKAVLVKSDLHPATDGPKLPIVPLWQQMVAQVRPSLIITTGTAGGVGSSIQLGDVVATASVRWDCKEQFAAQPWATSSYSSPGGLSILNSAPVQSFLLQATQQLMPANTVPRTGTPAVWGGTTVSTDFFAFDDANNYYGLRTYQEDASAVEMDDSALPLALGDDTTPWLSVRNASDPQMNYPTLAEEKEKAAEIYRDYGYATTVNSAVAVWAIIAGLGQLTS